MFDIEEYIAQLLPLLRDRLGERLQYVGLQGSYLRGEATADSDIDIMVVIEDMTVADLDTYRDIIQTLPAYDRSCGFLCGQAELAGWNPMEICHVLHSTKDYFGKLSELVPPYTDADVRNYVKISVNNLFHEICHRYIHAPQACSEAAIAGSYKQVFFILQDLHYLETDVFVPTKRRLLPRLSGKDQQVLQIAMELSGGKAYPFGDLFNLLYSWCQETIRRI